jgi:hypothetical protein
LTEPQVTIPTRTAASWLIALLPLVVALVGGALLISGISARLGLVTFGLTGLVLFPVTVGLGFWDVTTLRSRGSSMALAHALWVLLGGWVYLLVRAVVLKGADRERWVLLAVNVGAGLITSVVAVVGVAVLFSDADLRRELFYQQAGVEHTIERSISNRAGIPVQVDCPEDPPIERGDAFECSVLDESGFVLGAATVTWTDSFGTFEWEAHPGTEPSPQT